MLQAGIPRPAPRDNDAANVRFLNKLGVHRSMTRRTRRTRTGWKVRRFVTFRGGRAEGASEPGGWCSPDLPDSGDPPGLPDPPDLGSYRLADDRSTARP